MGDEHHNPGHDHDHHGADRGSQIGGNAFDPHLRQNRCQRGENRRTKCKPKPHDISSEKPAASNRCFIR